MSLRCGCCIWFNHGPFAWGNHSQDREDLEPRRNKPLETWLTSLMGRPSAGRKGPAKAGFHRIGAYHVMMRGAYPALALTEVHGIKGSKKKASLAAPGTANYRERECSVCVDGSEQNCAGPFDLEDWQPMCSI